MKYGDMKDFYMITNGTERANYLTASSSSTRTKGLQIKPAVVGIKTNERRWRWIMNGDLPEREKAHSKSLHGFKGKSSKYLEYRSTALTR